MIHYENLPELLKISQVCQILNIHPNTLRNWDKQGRLRAIRLGVRGDRRYHKDDIFYLLQTHNMVMK